MKKFKRLGALFVALCMLLSMTAFAAGATGAIVLTIGSPTMSVNGTAKTIDAEGSRASLYKGNTMLPLRSVVENMGGTVSWNASTKQIVMKYNGSTVTMTLGSKIAYSNGVKKNMTVAPFTDNGRTYVWLRSLEFFPSVTVNWRADTRQATVVYPMVAGSTLGGQPLQLKITNTSPVIYNEIRMAPAGTENWGANILKTPLYMNSIADVTINVAKAKYDMQLTSYYGQKAYFRNMDFTKAGQIGSLNITAADTYSLILDGIIASGADSTVNLNLYNGTGQQIRSIVYAPTNTGLWSDELLSNYYLPNNSAVNLMLKYAAASPYYDFRVTYSSGVQYTFSGVNLSSQWGTQLIRLNANGQVSYSNSPTGGGNTSSSGSTTVTFKNNSGKTVYELRMAPNNTDFSFKNAENLIDTTKNGSTDDFKFDLAGSRSWYIRAYDKNGKTLESGKVTFSSINAKSATITLKRNGDFIMGSDSSSSSGDGLLIANLSDDDIYGMFIIDPDDDYYKSSWDYDDFNDEYDDVGSLDKGEYDTFDLELYGRDDNELELVVFTDDRNFVTRDISFGRNISDYGVICITDIGSSSFSYSKYDDYSDDIGDDHVVLAIYNEDTSKKLQKVYVRDAEDGDDSDDRENDFDSTDILGSGTTLSCETGTSEAIKLDEWKNDGYYDFLFVFEDGTRVVLDDIDLSDYDYFVKLSADRDGASEDGE